MERKRDFEKPLAQAEECPRDLGPRRSTHDFPTGLGQWALASADCATAFPKGKRLPLAGRQRGHAGRYVEP